MMMLARPGKRAWQTKRRGLVAQAAKYLNWLAAGRAVIDAGPFERHSAGALDD
jgi:hypothetical protein